MLCFELLKILKNRVNQIAMLLGAALIAVVFCSIVVGEDIYDVETDQYIKGRAAVALAREQAAGQTDLLTDAFVRDYLKELQKYPKDLNSDDAYVEVIRKNGSLFYFLVNSCSEINNSFIDMNILKTVDTEQEDVFYRYRMEKITEYLNRDFSFGNYSEAEKNFWLNKAAQIREPFAWGNKAAATFLLDIISLGFYLLAVILVCLAPVFSKEKESGALQLLFTTRYGKTRMVRAKIFASLIFAWSYSILCLGIGCLTIWIYCGGIPELSLPIQLWANYIPYNFTAGQTIVLTAIMILLIVTIMTMILLLASAWTGNTLASMAITLMLTIGPAFIPASKNCRLFNRIIELAVVRQANIITTMERFTSYRLGPVILDSITMASLVYITGAIVIALCIRKIYVR